MPRILFITPNPPFPPTTGGNQRTNLILRALRRVCPTDMLLLAYPQRLAPEHLQHLRDEYALVGCVGTRARAEHGLWRYLRPFSQDRIDTLAEHFGRCEPGYDPQPLAVAELQRCLSQQHYDVVVVRYLRAATQTGALAYTPVVVDVDDLDTQVCHSELNRPDLSRLRRALVQQRLQRLRPVVQRWLARATYLWVSNRCDLASPGLERGRWVPNIPFEAANGPVAMLPDRPDSPTVLSVGSLHYPPHVAGVDFFVRDVWPQVYAAVPNARFCIVGTGLTESQRRRWNAVPGVEPRGFVSDLRTAYETSAFSVTPDFIGGGTHIKVVESLYYGRAVLVTRYGLRGYEDTLRHGESVYVAGDSEQMAAGCVALLRDPGLRVRLASAGHRLVVSEYTFDRIRTAVEHTVEEGLLRGGIQTNG